MSKKKKMRKWPFTESDLKQLSEYADGCRAEGVKALKKFTETDDIKMLGRASGLFLEAKLAELAAKVTRGEA